MKYISIHRICILTDNKNLNTLFSYPKYRSRNQLEDTGAWSRRF